MQASAGTLDQVASSYPNNYIHVETSGSERSSTSPPPPFEVTSESSTEGSPLPWKVPGVQHRPEAEQSSSPSRATSPAADEFSPEYFHWLVDQVNIAKQNTLPGDRFRRTVGEYYLYHYVLKEPRNIPDFALPWVEWSRLHPLSRHFLHDILDYPENYRDSFPFGAVSTFRFLCILGLYTARFLRVDFGIFRTVFIPLTLNESQGCIKIR